MMEASTINCKSAALVYRVLGLYLWWMLTRLLVLKTFVFWSTTAFEALVPIVAVDTQWFEFIVACPKSCQR